MLNELKSMLKWDNVRETDEGYIIVFNMEEQRHINGLRRDLDTFYLDFDLPTTPIAFEVRDRIDGYTFLYWTLNRRLHRMNDKPAKVIIRNKNCVRKWYFNGLLHRDNNPAYENIAIKSVNENILNFSCIEQQHSIFGIPKGGELYYYDGTRKMDGQEVVELDANHFTINYDKKNRKSDRVQLTSLTLKEYSFKDGKHSFDKMSGVWYLPSSDNGMCVDDVEPIIDALNKILVESIEYGWDFFMPITPQMEIALFLEYEALRDK